MSLREELYTRRKIRAKKEKYPRKATFAEINHQPLEFMPPVPPDLKGEGYWSDTYLPIVSQQDWPGKQQWMDKVKFIELHVQVRDYFGCAYSRVIPDFEVGSSEYQDGDVFWPGGYVEHYIGDHNVMPTERFYNYVNEKYSCLRNKMPFNRSQFSLK